MSSPDKSSQNLPAANIYHHRNTHLMGGKQQDFPWHNNFTYLNLTSYFGVCVAAAAAALHLPWSRIDRLSLQIS